MHDYSSLSTPCIHDLKIIADKSKLVESIFVKELINELDSKYALYSTVVQGKDKTVLYHQKISIKPEVMCVTFLSVLHSIKPPLIHNKTGKKGMPCTYVDARLFLNCFYSTKLKKYLSDLGVIPSTASICRHCKNYAMPEAMVNCIHEWTKQVSVNFPTVKPLDKSKIILGHKKLLLHIAYTWKQDNPIVTTIVREYFKSDW